MDKVLEQALEVAERPKGRCWFNRHKMTIWSEPDKLTNSGGLLQVFGSVPLEQRRRCVNCNKVERRFL